MTTRSPIISPETLARAPRRAGPPDRRRPLGAGLARAPAGSATRPATSPARSSSTSTRTSPRRPGRAVIRCRSPADFAARLEAARDRRRATRSWPMTTSAARSRPGCGGCSTTSAIERVRVLDGGLPAWLAAGLPVTTEPPSRGRPGSLHLRDAWTNVIDRDAVVARARPARPARCPRRAALPRRGRADRPRPGPHPDRDAAPRPTATSGRIDGCCPAADLAERFDALGVTAARPGRHLVRQRRDRLLHQPGHAGRRPAGPDPVPRARTATGAAPACRSRSGPSRASRRPREPTSD